MNDSLLTTYIRNEDKNAYVYDVRLISDMLMHGARPDEEAELRETAIKGVLRYFWRALNGETARNKRDLLVKESRLFGGTDPKLKSPLSLKIEQEETSMYRRVYLPHKTESNQNRPKPALRAGGTFQLELRIPSYMSQKKLEEYKNYLELTMLLGSFGQRARRGFGSIQVGVYEDETAFLNEVTKRLEYCGKKVERQNNSLYLGKQNRVNPPTIERIYVGRKESEMNDILKTIHHATHEHNARGDLGYVNFRPFRKWSSPLWCTIKKVQDGYIPVVTELISEETGKRKHYEYRKRSFLTHLGVDVYE